MDGEESALPECHFKAQELMHEPFLALMHMSGACVSKRHIDVKEVQCRLNTTADIKPTDLRGVGRQRVWLGYPSCSENKAGATSECLAQVLRPKETLVQTRKG